MTLASRLRVVGLIAAGSAAVIAACSTTTTTTTFTPITGIEIRSSALVAGFGCGMAPGQVFRYAAVVSFAGTDGGAPPAPLFTNIFDCFTDGVFENLPTSDAGSLTFNVAIFAYNQDDYFNEAHLPANLGCVPTLDGGGTPDCAPGTLPLTAAQESRATWTTTCTATQQAGTPVIAVCGVLMSPSATVPDASTDAAADGSEVPETGPAADAAQDGTTAPEPDAASDAGMTSPDADASPDGSLTDGSSSTDS